MKNKFLILCTALVLTMCIGTLNLNAGATKPTKPSKPFLIQGKLPHPTGILKSLWNDEDLALTAKQKEKLLLVRKNTIKQVRALSKEINMIENYLVKSALNGEKPEDLKEDMYELAKLRAKASMVHLNCIYDTKEILTKEQYKIIE